MLIEFTDADIATIINALVHNANDYDDIAKMYPKQSSMFQKCADSYRYRKLANKLEALEHIRDD